ncbi:hypothetical protein [Kitasatospora sp. NPDC098663]|uniref:hypothetical protein n=1 Tax=Kitasatospora sp. NPDC098663 TaxID=3364096 RepID=UPI0037FF52E6
MGERRPGRAHRAAASAGAQGGTALWAHAGPDGTDGQAVAELLTHGGITTTRTTGAIDLPGVHHQGRPIGRHGGVTRTTTAP